MNYNKAARSARKKFFSGIIADNTDNLRKPFSVLNHLLNAVANSESSKYSSVAN